MVLPVISILPCRIIRSPGKTSLYRRILRSAWELRPQQTVHQHLVIATRYHRSEHNLPHLGLPTCPLLPLSETLMQMKATTLEYSPSEQTKNHRNRTLPRLPLAAITILPLLHLSSLARQLRIQVKTILHLSYNFNYTNIFSYPQLYISINTF